MSVPSTSAAVPTDYVPRRRAPQWLIQYGNFLFRTRDAVFPIVMIGLAVLTSPGIETPGRWLDLVGFLVAAAGQLLRVAVVGYRYIVRGGRNRQVYAEGLVTTGYFALSRNPLYVGNLLILAGILLVWNSPIMYAVGIPFFVIGYRAIVAAEEDYLGRQYGKEFDAYCDRVPRWWPALHKLGKATDGMTFNWPRVIIKEYGSAAYWVAGMIVMLAVKAKRYAQIDGSEASMIPYGVAGALVVVAWGTARFLKKTKRLRGD